jgi:hypothetical protein
MSKKLLVIFFIGIFYCSVTQAQGTNCSNATTIPLDGTCYTYNTSTNTDNSVHCTGAGYGGNGRVTYFRFTTNSTPQCVSLDITASVAGTRVEAVLYSGCSGTTPTGGNAYQSLCMDDGEGIWATNLWYSNLLPNTTYYLRVRTEQGFTGALQICGKHETPTNNTCAGSTQIDNLTTPNQNNACNLGSTEVPPANLCAGSLENTAWYTFTVLSSGVSSIVISNLNCDNANFAGNSDYGFQIGFFTGNCGSLTPTNCQAENGAAGGTVIASSTSLPAGTVVHVAIDGFGGSNCGYDILAINATPLSVKLKYFEGWRGADFNLLTWVSLSETNNQYYEIERSGDGINFLPIGRITGQIRSVDELKYSFKDKNPLQVGYYRLKQVDINGNDSYSRIIRIAREKILSSLNVSFANPVNDIIKLNIETSVAGSAQIQIVDIAGKTMLLQSANWQKGFNQQQVAVRKLTAGNYYLVITQDGNRKAYPFIKF